MRLLIGFLILLTTFAATAATETMVSDASSMRFAVLSDIHFDPFYSCERTSTAPCPLIQRLRSAAPEQWAALLSAADKQMPVYRQNTNYPLLVSTLSAVKQAAAKERASFVLVLGDMVCHKSRKLYKKYAHDSSRAGYQAFIKKMLVFLNQEIAKTFPAIDVYSLVGNNDSYRHDYQMEPRGAFFADMASVWSSLVKTEGNRARMRREFPQGGYYAVDVPGQRSMRLIMLNSVLFSNQVRGDKLSDAANQELDWLQTQLAQAEQQHQRVLLAMHIPDGIDVYASLRVHLFKMIEFWKPAYTQRFQQMLSTFAPTIAGVFAGHLHADWFQVQRFGGLNEIPILGTPSVSPIYGNNPGFKIYSYSLTSRQLDDFIAYYYPLGSDHGWRVEYDFSRIYKPNCLDCPVTTGMNAVRQTGALAAFYKLYYSVRTTSQPITTQWSPYYWCAIHTLAVSHYRQCIA